MTELRTAAQQALEALEAFMQDDLRPYDAQKAITALRAALAQQAEPVQEPDLSRCPQCNGPADNGHDRSIPPNPYLCTKCMAEMPQPSYNVIVVDDAHPNGIPLEQWQNKQVQEPVAWMESPHGAIRANPLYKHVFPSQLLHWQVPLYTAPPQRKPLTEGEIERHIGYRLPAYSMRLLLELVNGRAHGIGGDDGQA